MCVHACVRECVCMWHVWLVYWFGFFFILLCVNKSCSHSSSPEFEAKMEFITGFGGESEPEQKAEEDNKKATFF